MSKRPVRIFSNFPAGCDEVYADTFCHEISLLWSLSVDWSRKMTKTFYSAEWPRNAANQFRPEDRRLQLQLRRPLRPVWWTSCVTWCIDCRATTTRRSRFWCTTWRASPWRRNATTCRRPTWASSSAPLCCARPKEAHRSRHWSTRSTRPKSSSCSSWTLTRYSAPVPHPPLPHTIRRPRSIRPRDPTKDHSSPRSVWFDFNQIYKFLQEISRFCGLCGLKLADASDFSLKFHPIVDLFGSIESVELPSNGRLFCAD